MVVVGMTCMVCRIPISARDNFGRTYLTLNDARANLRLGQRDSLIQENWVNSEKGHCAMNQSQV